MDPTTIDISIIARDLKLAPPQVETAIELLDSGNTIPFITRFRKDQTGGLHEDQILAIKTKAAQLRALAERKSSVLRSIESQGELTDALREQIQKTTTSRRLEEIYLPFKTRKQSRASLARQQGLGPLADEILNHVDSDIDFATRATDFVRVDKGLNSVDDVIKGVGDLVAERFAENESLRKELGKLVRNKGLLSSTVIEPKSETNESPQVETSEATPSEETVTQEKADSTAPAANQAAAADSDSTVGAQPSQPPTAQQDSETSDNHPQVADTGDSQNDEQTHAMPSSEGSTEPADGTAADAASIVASQPDGAKPSTNDAAASSSDESNSDKVASAEPAPSTETTSAPAAAENQAAGQKKKKKKKKKKKQDPFRDYFDFEQPISKVPHYRVLAINRGERAGKLRVKIKIDPQTANEIAFEKLVPADHPSAEFLKKCAAETVSRSLLPSIEREIRRELTEAAEAHAVDVFAKNLKNLLLTPPIRNRVVLAIDPGFKRGCTVAVLDPAGRLLDSGQIFVVGKQPRREDSLDKLKQWILQHQVDHIVIGNGTGCRQVEQMVSEVMAELESKRKTRYIIINEAGTSIYSTSEIGREELPDVSPAIRSAISIGRRLQDPLSELVKIAPANIGVGMYQHDIKAKHLAESLDEVVQSCVNRVGVDVNTASAALLKYVSGLNALTARRVIEYRNENGRFNQRTELKNVNGVGDTTYVQAAGFLRIHGGDNPLDATSIHPECYPIAEDIMQRVDASVEEILPRWLMQPKREELAQQTATEGSTPAPEGNSASTAASVAAPTGANDDQTAGDSTTAESVDASPAAEAAPTAEAAPVSETDSTVESSTEPMPAETTTSPVTSANELATEASAETDWSTEIPKTAIKSNDDSYDESDQRESGSASRREFDQRRKDIVKKMSSLDIEQIAGAHQSGKLLVKDVIMSLKRPAWDPRDKAQKPLFRTGILKVEDLKVDMELSGQVVNVVDFGVFVDIGLGESSLVHVSQLSNHYISDPHQRFAVGDLVKVWVTEIDTQRRRVKLTAVKPGTSKPPRRKPRNRNEQREHRAETKPTGRKPGKYEKRAPKSDGRRKSGGAPPRRQTRRAPKPVKPITEEMLRGDAPMKSFSDLLQFVNHKADDKSQAAAAEAKKQKAEPKGDQS